MSAWLLVVGKNLFADEPSTSFVATGAGAGVGKDAAAGGVAGEGDAGDGFGVATPSAPEPVISAFRAAAATTGAGTCAIDGGAASLGGVSPVGVLADVAAAASGGGPASYADLASPFDCTSRSIVAREASSSLMNFTPIPPGESVEACAASRFHTTRPTPPMTATSPAMRISNLRSVPAANGVAVLMKTPPLLTSYEWFSMNSSTVALL